MPTRRSNPTPSTTRVVRGSGPERPPKTIQAIMRHSTITLALDIYGHLMARVEQRAIAVLEEFQIDLQRIKSAVVILVVAFVLSVSVNVCQCPA